MADAATRDHGAVSTGLFRPAGPRTAVVSIAGWLALLVVAVVVLHPIRSDRNVGAIALLMLLPPLAATGSGPIVAGAAALVSGLVFNFFFTHPYDSPSVASSASVAALVVYVVVAMTLAVLASRLRDARDAATTRAREAMLLQRLTVDLITVERLEPVLREAVAALVEALGLRGAELEVSFGDEQVRAVSGTVVDRGARRFAIESLGVGQGTLVTDPGEVALDAGRVRVIDSFAGIVALAVARARLAEEGARRRALEETDRLRSILLQSVSHDLRTPLTAIKASASALRMVPPPPAVAETMLSDIEEHADRLSRLVENLLDLSRIESGTLILRRQPVPVDELVAGAIDAARSELGRLAVDVRLAADLPPLPADETMIRQVLVNLLANAARHDPDGPIEVVASAGEGVVALSVRDHGPGVPIAERDRLATPLAARARASGGRAGVGLAIATGFVQAHGGTLRLEDTPGGGATFVVEMPAVELG